MRDLRVDSPVFLGARSIFEIEKIAGARRHGGSIFFGPGDLFRRCALLSTPNSKDICRGEETRRFYFLRPWKSTSLMLLSEELIVADSILAYFLSEVRSLGLADATAFSRLPCFADRRRPDRNLGLPLLVGCFPLLLSPRGTTTRTFSGYRAVLGTRSLHIPVIYLVFHNSARLLFSPAEWNEGCWGV